MRPLYFLFLTGCLGALGSGPTPTVFRYFSPEHERVETTAAVVASTSRPILRLGRVTASASLRSRIVRRETEHELGVYETLRWTDDPDVYVRRALTRSLFDEGRAEQVTGGSAPVLEVELISFEEVTAKYARGGRVALRYELRDDDRVVASGVAESQRRADGTTMEATVAAIGQAMDDAVTEVTQSALRGLSSKR